MTYDMVNFQRAISDPRVLNAVSEDLDALAYRINVFPDDFPASNRYDGWFQWFSYVSEEYPDVANEAFRIVTDQADDYEIVPEGYVPYTYEEEEFDDYLGDSYSLSKINSAREAGHRHSTNCRRRTPGIRHRLQSSRIPAPMFEAFEYFRGGVQAAVDELLASAPLNLPVGSGKNLTADDLEMINQATEEFAHTLASYWYSSTSGFNSSKARLNSAEEKPEETEEEEEWHESEQEFTSKGTAVNALSGKLPVLFKMVDSKIGWKSGTINLDYGGGTEQATAVADKYFEDKGVTNLIYDKYNQTAKHNDEVRKTIRNNGGADTATLSNVLNVIKEDKERLNVLKNVHNLLKGSGTLYIYCYSGTKENQAGGARSTKKDQWQNFRTTDSYIPEVEEVFGEGNVKMVGGKANGFIMAKK